MDADAGSSATSANCVNEGTAKGINFVNEDTASHTLWRIKLKCAHAEILSAIGNQCRMDTDAGRMDADAGSSATSPNYVNKPTASHTHKPG